MATGKTYIPDTNIAIDDTFFLKDFLKDTENKVVLPDVVISEIDRLKKHPEVGYEARAFHDYIFTLIPNGVNIANGVEVTLNNGEKGGRFYINNRYAFHGIEKPVLEYNTDIGVNDLNIIRSTVVYQNEHPDENVILVSNDKNLITIARINGVNAEYMRKDAADSSKLRSGYVLCKNKGLIKYALTKNKSSIPLKEINEEWAENLVANEYVVFVNDVLQSEIEKSLKYNSKMVFSVEPALIKRYDIFENALVPTGIPKNNFSLFGFTPRNLEQTLLIDQLMNDNIHIKAVKADAGTGKSFLELLVAIYKTTERRKKKISDAKVSVIRRAMFSEEYGFLPGDIVDKNKPTYEGVEDNYNLIMKYYSETAGKGASDYATKLSDAITESDGLIELLPFGTIRGQTLGPDRILIGEEWQNTEIKFSKMMMDRNGDGEVYVNGDTEQTDNPHTSSERNGLTYLIKRIEQISRRARKTRDELDLFDASVAGIMSLQKSERGLINAWSLRNLSRHSQRFNEFG